MILKFLRRLTQAPHLQRGDHAEAMACRYLAQHGLRLLAKNYRCRYGEVDLVMQEGIQVVFVEVRYRASNRFGNGVASVNRLKQKRIIKTATHYLQKQQLLDKLPCRFDIIAITERQRIPKIRWVKNAFSE